MIYLSGETIHDKVAPADGTELSNLNRILCFESRDKRDENYQQIFLEIFINRGR